MSSMLTSAARNSASTRHGASRQVTSSPRSAEMKAGPRHFWARNQFSDHASRRRAARRYVRRTCNYDPLTGFHSVNRSGEDTQGSSEILNQLGLQHAFGVAPIGLDPPLLWVRDTFGDRRPRE